MAQSTWESNSIQFPRLLAEVRAIGLTSEQYAELGASMDLDRDAIDTLLERAESDWERIKGDTTGQVYRCVPVPNGAPSRIAIGKPKGLDLVLDNRMCYPAHDFLPDGKRICIATWILDSGDGENPGCDNCGLEDAVGRFSGEALCEDCSEGLAPDTEPPFHGAWMPSTVQCKFCHRSAPASTAHRHDGGWVGDECCWVEQLRSSE